MADTNAFGFDPSQLQGLLAQFAPTDEEKRRALTQGLAAAGFGMLGARGVNGMQAIGQGGLLGINAYNGALDQAGQQQRQGLQSAMQAMQLKEGMQKFQDQDAFRQLQAQMAGKFPIGGAPAPAQAPQMAADGMGPPAIPAAPQSATAPIAQSDGLARKRAMADQFRQQAAAYAQSPLPQAQAMAQSLMDRAEKILPKLSKTQSLTQNGQRVVVNFYDDGSHEILSDVGPDQEKAVQLDTGNAIGAVDPFTLQPIKGGGLYQKQVTPDAQLSANTAMRGQNMTNARALATENGVPEQFTPDAIDNAAARYNIDGTLPPMGMGRSGVNARAAILNRAAELAKGSGMSGDEQRINQIGNKANSAALSKLQQSQSMIGAFEKNFNMNADMALDLSKKVDNTGVPLANKWINAGKRSITGDPQLAAYDTAVKATVNEYAKIISGSMGNTVAAEGEMKKVNDLLNSAQTPQQVAAVLDYMKKETENRMIGFEQEKAALRAGMSGKKPAATGQWSVKRVD